jgi:DHA1 family tetracycline resistance protein-like MFS transporter
MWGPALIGWMLTVAGVADIVSRAIVLPALLKRYSEQHIGTAGLIALCAGLSFLVITFFAPSIFLVVVAILCITFGEGLFDPLYNGQLSNSVTEAEQGKLQGVNQSLQSAYRVIVPILAATIYYFGTYLVYVVAALVALSALAVFIKLRSMIIGEYKT